MCEFQHFVRDFFTLSLKAVPMPKDQGRIEPCM